MASQDAATHDVPGEGQPPAASPMEQVEQDALLQQVAGVFVLWWNWAYIELSVTTPTLAPCNPPAIIPALNSEFVYPIVDGGHTLTTSKATDMYSVGMSMCKLFYTIEKMFVILVNRLKEGENGIDDKTEVQITFQGHLSAQRKAFETTINLPYNFIVTNFDPGAWGERYLNYVKIASEKGKGHPSAAPREIYKLANTEPRTAGKNS